MLGDKNFKNLSPPGQIHVPGLLVTPCISSLSLTTLPFLNPLRITLFFSNTNYLNLLASDL